MKKKRKKSRGSNDPFLPFRQQAIGLGGTAVTTGVSAATAAGAIAGAGPAGALVTPMMGGFTTIAQGTGIANLAITGGNVLNTLERSFGKKKKKKYY